MKRKLLAACRFVVVFLFGSSGMNLALSKGGFPLPWETSGVRLIACSAIGLILGAMGLIITQLWHEHWALKHYSAYLHTKGMRERRDAFRRHNEHYNLLSARNRRIFHEKISLGLF